MTVSAISSTAASTLNPLDPLGSAKPAKSGGAEKGGAAGGAGGSQGASGSGSSSSSSSSSTIVSEATQVNPDGSTTTGITYADGTSSTSNTPAPQGKGGVPSLLDPSNAGQNATLLGAQEQNGNKKAA